MQSLEETTIDCPYCGETIDVFIDTSVEDQQYIEDCQVCCRPINFVVQFDEAQQLVVNVFHENE